MNWVVSLRKWVSGDLALLVLLALVNLILHTVTNGQYGFHRDELAMLDDARALAWGYVAYPPVTPFIGRLALTLFGPSLIGIRFFAALAQSAAVLLAGLMAREMGGRRAAQLLAAVAVAIAPVAMAMSTLFQYVAFDYLWWVLIAYLFLRLANSGDPRWWLAIGAAIGLGMLTKYTLAFYLVGIAAGVLLTSNRRYLASPWLWGGAALALALCLPNLIWQAQHGFISLEFLSSIHARDVRIGRTASFLTDQLIVPANPFTIPLWLAGLAFLVSRAGKPYRPLAWMAVVPIVLFWVAQGRGYYTGPAYPMLLSAGAVAVENWISSLSAGRARLASGAVWGLLAVGGIVITLLGPYAPVNSGLWKIETDVNSDWKEEIGWPELVQTVAGIRASLPATEPAPVGILAHNYGEAGAIDLYGPAYGLPRAISGADSYWRRGYGDPAPQTLIVLGYDQSQASSLFQSCDLAGHVTNQFGVANEETTYHPDIFVCHDLRQSWKEFWKSDQEFQ